MLLFLWQDGNSFSISYGTADAGNTVHADPTVHKKLLKLSKTLNLEPHEVVQGVEMAMCVDLEVHKEGDKYIVLGMKMEFFHSNTLKRVVHSNKVERYFPFSLHI